MKQYLTELLVNYLMDLIFAFTAIQIVRQSLKHMDYTVLFFSLFR